MHKWHTDIMLRTCHRVRAARLGSTAPALNTRGARKDCNWEHCQSHPHASEVIAHACAYL